MTRKPKPMTWLRRAKGLPRFHRSLIVTSKTVCAFMSYLQITRECTIAPKPFWNWASRSIRVTLPL
ncbi:MAG: hypothetical protein ACXVDJ_10875, partial [Tumebacillaceae bacterium]